MKGDSATPSVQENVMIVVVFWGHWPNLWDLAKNRSSGAREGTKRTERGLRKAQKGNRGH